MTDEFCKQLEDLRKPFPANKVYQRKGPGGKMLDFVAGETVLERLLEVVPTYSVDAEVVSVDPVVVKATLTVGEKSGAGLGSARMGDDLDSSLKAALTEAIKNSAKNTFGVALELWNAEHRESLGVARRAAGGSEAALKKAVFDRAKEMLKKQRPTVQEVARLFDVEPSDLSDVDTLRRILESEGVL